MAETLGSLCDKLTIVKLKEWHSEKQPERMRSLATHREEIGYEIEKVPPDARDGIVKQLAVLNLERTQCIDEIDRQLRAAVEQMQSKAIKH